MLDAGGTALLTEPEPLSPWLFHDRLHEPETGLYWMRARHYHPRLGRFLQPDPIGVAGGANLYAYANNNPLRWFDPWGLTPETAADAVEESDEVQGGDSSRYGWRSNLGGRWLSEDDWHILDYTLTYPEGTDLGKVRNELFTDLASFEYFNEENMASVRFLTEDVVLFESSMPPSFGPVRLELFPHGNAITGTTQFGHFLIGQRTWQVRSGAGSSLTLRTWGVEQAADPVIFALYSANPGYFQGLLSQIWRNYFNNLAAEQASRHGAVLSEIDEKQWSE